jgi:hypothetical protein
MTETPDADDIAMTDVSVTCQTEGCSNAGHAITLSVPADPTPPFVVCGVCGQQINDIN